MLLYGIDLTERRISQISSELRKLGLLGVQRTGFGRSNRYILHLPLSPDSATLEGPETLESAGVPESRPDDAELNRVSGRDGSTKEQNERTFENMNFSFSGSVPAGGPIGLLPQARLNLFQASDDPPPRMGARKSPPGFWMHAADQQLLRMREAEEKVARKRNETAEAILPGLERLRGAL